MKTKIAHLFPGISPFVRAAFLLPVLIALSPMGSHGAALNMDVRPENTTVFHNSDGTSTIQVRIIAPDEVPLDDRPPLNLALVLDKSGSMADSGKIRYVIQAAHMLVNRLGPEDILSVVVYNDKVRVAVPARKVRDKELFHRTIDGLYPGGRTYLSGGLEEGYRQVRRNRKKGYVSRMVLLSDGLANVGVTDTGHLRRRAGAMYESGVSVSTFGMGLEFDEDLLSSMAYGGGGSYHYIARPADILAALDREFHMASRTVASGIQIIIRPSPGCRFDSAPGHHWRMEKGSAVIGLGDLSAGETRTLIARMSVPTASLGSMDVAKVSVLYKDPVTGETSSRDQGPVVLRVVDDPTVYLDNFNEKVQEKKAVIESSAMMEEAARKVDKGDKDGALTIIRKVLGSLKSAPPSAAVQGEMERVQDYSGKLESMDDMAPSEQEEMQKEMKYRNYQEMYQQ